MAPKAAPKVVGPVLPEPDEEVQWPEDVEPVPDPTFFFAVAHVVSHVFRLESPEPGPDGGPPALVEFDPCAQLLAALKEEATEDPLSTLVNPVDREELQSHADSSGGGSLAKGLRLKLEKESAARSRRKVNAARTKHITEKQAEAAGTCSIDSPLRDQAESEGQQKESLDFILVVFDCPGTAEELQQLQEEGIFDIPDMWVTTYLAGQNIREDFPPEDPDGEPGEPQRVREVCKPPDGVMALYDAIHEAAVGTGLANATILTLPDSHQYAPSTSSADAVENPAAPIREAIVKVMLDKTSSRCEFKEWFNGVQERIDIPAARPMDTVVYDKLAGAVDPARHDVPLILHCLCEQVAHNLRGDLHDGHGPCGAEPAKDDDELLHLDEFLEEMHIHTALGVPIGVQHAPKVAWEEPAAPNNDAPDDIFAIDDGVDPLVLPSLDKLACRHAGDELPGGASVTDAVHRIISHVSEIGIRRSGFPEEEPASAPRRAAKRNRIYPRMPDISVVEIEKLLLLHEFEQLLNKAQPERTWCLKDRVFHERIPRDFLVQVLLDAFRQECFVETAYVDRHDALLIVLYHRALPARMLWHGWYGDLLRVDDSRETASEAKKTNMYTTPGFNDWCHFSASTKSDSAAKERRASTGHADPSSEKSPFMIGPPSRLLELDARESGYCRITEKCLTPSDRSVILRTALQRGIGRSFPPPPPGRDLPPPEPEVEKKEEGEKDELNLLKGLNDAEESKAPSKRDAKTTEFHPAPRHEMKSVRVVKDGFTFGIVTDEAWAARRKVFRDKRKAQEKSEAEAAAAAAAAAAAEAEEQDGEPAAPPADPASADGVNAEANLEEASVADSLSDRKLENLNLGLFWATFPDGARCSVRIHHERPFWPEDAFSYQVTESRPGVVFIYSPMAGLVVQVFSDGSVYQTWPHELRGPGLKGTILGRHQAPDEGGTGIAGPVPGGLEDAEVGRIVTPFGTVIREMLSGRREVYHPDGTVAARNPTVAELRAECERARLSGNAAQVRFLESLAAFSSEVLHGHEDVPTAQPSEHAKSLGIPGHWKVMSPGGSVIGRFAVPPKREVVRDESERDPALDDAAPDDAAPDETADEDRVESPDMTLEELLGGVLIDDGSVLEYEIEDVSSTSQVDPHTQQRVTSTAQGLTLFQEHSGLRRVCIHADGTRMFWDQGKDGYKVSVEKDRAARVSCTVQTQGYSPSAMVKVECADDSVLEVVPRCLSLKGELVPSDPNVGNPLHSSTNASVRLRRREGTVINSRGGGDIDIASGFDITAKGEKELFQSFDRTGAYTANVEDGVIRMTDDDGNTFEVRGDQSVDCKLAVSMGDDYKSPRCAKSGHTYLHPHAAFLPLPEDVPEPRLFVVYGDGESEELLLGRDALETLRLAKEDPNAIVVGPERLGTPMEVCCCHTIFRATSSDTSIVPPLPLTLPPMIAGFHHRSTDPQHGAGRAHTQFRQLIQYPDVSDDLLKRFHAERIAQEESEKQLRARYDAYGQGYRDGRRRSRSPAKMSIAPPTVAPADGGA